MEDDFYYGELPELPPPVANTAPELVDEDDNPMENPDLELGWLKNETKTVHHDAVEGVKKVSHYEVNLKPDGTPAIYYDANGKEYGRDVHEVIDVPGVQARDAYDEEVAFIRYIKYTAEELAKNTGVMLVKLKSGGFVAPDEKFREAARLVLRSAKRKYGSAYWFHPLIGKFQMSGGIPK